MNDRALQIVIASGVRGDTRRYRTVHLAEQCRLVGLDARLSHVMEPDFPQAAERADLLVLHRAALDRVVEKAIRSIQQRGGRVIYDTDDLLFDPEAFQWIDSPDFRDPLRARLYREDMQRMRRAMEACDALQVSTTFLAGQATSLGKPIFIHRNGFSLAMLAICERLLSRQRTAQTGFVIGYASGTPTHNRDFASIAGPLQKALGQHAGLSLWVIGSLKLDRDFQAFPHGRVLRLGHVPWTLLPGYLARFDLNLAPLVRDNPFARSKSEIKWMEAALVGVPTLATPADAFAESIQPGRDGFLADDAGQWAEMLEELIADRERAARVGQAALERVSRDYHPLVRAGELLRIFNQVLPGAGLKMTPEVSQALPVTEKPAPSLFRMGLYTLRARGVGILAQQAWVYLRRAASPIFPYRGGKHDSS